MAGKGAGPGERRGGRQKGSLNKSTLAQRDAIVASGELPRDYMLRVMRDETADSSRRDDMARAAAPYIHPRLASVQVTDASLADLSDDELNDFIAMLRSLAGGGSHEDGARRAPAKKRGRAP